MRDKFTEKDGLIPLPAEILAGGCVSIRMWGCADICQTCILCCAPSCLLYSWVVGIVQLLSCLHSLDIWLDSTWANQVLLHAIDFCTKECVCVWAPRIHHDDCLLRIWIPDRILILKAKQTKVCLAKGRKLQKNLSNVASVQCSNYYPLT